MPIGLVRLARSARASGKNALDHIRITPAKNGGFNVQHFGNDYSQQPQSYTFGANEGQAMLSHVGQSLGVGGKTRPPASPPHPGKNPRGTRGMMMSSNRSVES